jgi:hypothetical protein
MRDSYTEGKSATPPKSAWVVEELKKEFGNRVTFRGGGVDTRQTLPFGTPEEVPQEVCSRLKLLRGPAGTFSI